MLTDDLMRLANELPEDQLFNTLYGFDYSYSPAIDKRYFQAYHMLQEAIDFETEARERASKNALPHHRVTIANYSVAVTEDLKVYSVIQIDTFRGPPETLYYEWYEDEDGSYCMKDPEMGSFSATRGFTREIYVIKEKPVHK